MRHAGLSVIRVLFFLLPVFAVLVICLHAAPAVAAASETLVLAPEKGLSVLGEPEALTVRGSAALVSPAALGSSEASIVVRLRGPAGSAQVRGEAPPPGVVGEVIQAFRPGVDIASDGSLLSKVLIPSAALDRPGGYLAEVDFMIGADVRASGAVWLGKVVGDGPAVDVATVWPLALGIHRDVEGVFFTTALEDAVAGSAQEEGAGAGSVTSLLTAGRALSGWRFTLALEPILLTQLRDLADGFKRRGPTGILEEPSADSEQARDARAALADLAELAARDTVGVIAAPFAGPSVDDLARRGWLDGLRQLQLGRQVVQQTLSPPEAVLGAYPLDLDVTTVGLSSYGRAAVDHILVCGSVADDLVEAPGAGGVTARVRDMDNHRATLVFADQEMMAFLSPPWDPGVFYAGFAAVLAERSPSGLVLTPGPGSGIPPGGYIEAVGRALLRLDRIVTRTLSDLIVAHPPGSRPALLERASSTVPGYIEQELQAAVEEAHRKVESVVLAAGPAAQTAASAQAFLFIAQSRWWSLPETGPAVATVGLMYADRARTLAATELAKVGGVALHATTVIGSKGDLLLRIDSTASYPMRVEVRFSPQGLSLPGGNLLAVDVPPGGVDVALAVQKERGDAALDVEVSAGTHVFGRDGASVRFYTATTLLPWTAFVLAIVAAGATLLAVRRWLGRKGSTKP